jgi:CcmD family protein
VKSLNYLYAAYVATWAIHGTYLWILVRKYTRLRREMQTVGKPPGTAANRPR